MFPLFFIASICIVALIILRNITPQRSIVSPKDIGQRFRVIEDKKFGVILQQYDEEAHLVIVSTDILLDTAIGKLVEIKGIEHGMPVCN